MLLDAGVQRARLDGVGEFEFPAPPAPEAPEVVEYEPPRPREMPASTPTPSDDGRQGYRQLFGNDQPAFHKPPVT